LVLGDLGEWFESDFVSEGFELLDGARLGSPGLVSGVVVGAGVTVESALTSMCQASVSMVCSMATRAIMPAMELPRDLFLRDETDASPVGDASVAGAVVGVFGARCGQCGHPEGGLEVAVAGAGGR